MKRLLFVAALAACTSLVMPDGADAQSRSSRSSGASSVNPAHERTKNDAQRAYEQRDYERTVELMNSVIAQNSRDHVAHYLRGSARVELGRLAGDAKQLRDGIADVRRAISLGGDDTINYYLPYLYGMTHLAAVENKPEHAEVALKVADGVLARRSLKDDERANLRYQRAIINVYLGKTDDAVADYQQAIDAQSNHLGAYVGIADAYVKARNHDAAIQSFDRAVEAFPENPLVYNNRGMYQQQRGEWDAAISDFTRALEIDEKYFYALTNRGFAAMRQGDLEVAESDFSASLAINPNQPPVLSMRGSVRLDRGDIDAAIADFRRVLQLDARNPTGQAELGFALFFKGDYRAAGEAFDRAAELNPELKYVQPWQFMVLELTGRKDEAQRRFSSAADANSAQHTWADDLLAYLSGDLTEEALLKSAEQNPQSQPARMCEAHFFIGWRHLQSGDETTAKKHFEQALATGQGHLSAYRGAKYLST